MQIVILLGLFALTNCKTAPNLITSLVDGPVKAVLDDLPVHDLLNIVPVPGITDALDRTWSSFKDTFDKHYTPDEDEQRHGNLLNSLVSIVTSNLQNLTYTLGLNKYSDLNHEEYMKYMNGFGRQRKERGKAKAKASAKQNEDQSLPPPRPGAKPFVPPPSSVKLPEKMDWREHGYVSSVKDQSLCGACWTFSAAGALEGQLKKKTGKIVSLSSENLLDCVTDNWGCEGGYMEPAFEYVQKNNGIDTYDSYPYKGNASKCYFNPSFIGATCKGFVELPSGDEHALKQAVATIGPISVAIDGDSAEFHHYRSGILDLPDCKNDFDSLSHAILVVGYGTENGLDYWLIKNSWSTSWGINGYAKLSRNKHNQCGIATVPSYPLM